MTVLELQHSHYAVPDELLTLLIARLLLQVPLESFIVVRPNDRIYDIILDHLWDERSVLHFQLLITCCMARNGRRTLCMYAHHTVVHSLWLATGWKVGRGT